MSDTTPANHAGLLVPLDMFRLSQLASMFAEILVSKARNILDAKLVLTRHVESPILLMRIEGSVVGDNPGEFWRDNADLVAVVSRAMPRQLIMYYVENAGTPERTEGFMVAQQGQVIAADDASADRMPPGSTDADWPVARLTQQLRIDPAALAAGFPGGPSVEVPLMEPDVDDQALLMTLVGQPPEGEDLGDTAPAPAPSAAASGAPPAASGAPPPARPKPPAAAAAAAEDAKRREKIRQEEEDAQRQRAAEVQSGMPYTVDDLGVVVTPEAEISETEILATFIVSSVSGDLPTGVPSNLAESLQGKRVDVAVRFDFLSEVFVDNTPLTRPQFEELAQTVQLAGQDLRKLEILGPRLGYGTMFSTGKKHVFVSRKQDMPMPEDLIGKLLSD